jgi:hypothetical protein
VLAISELNALFSLRDYEKYINEVEVHYLLAELYGEPSSTRKRSTSTVPYSTSTRTT